MIRAPSELESSPPDPQSWVQGILEPSTISWGHFPSASGP